MTRVTIIGAGNFGFALTKHFDQKNDASIDITVYDHDPELIRTLQRTREHPYVHCGTSVSTRIVFEQDLKVAVQDADVAILAVTSAALGGVCRDARESLKNGVILVNTAKALDAATGRRLSEVCIDELVGRPHFFAALAGGTIAADLFRHEPLGADVACEHASVAERLAGLLSSPNLTVYPTTDLVGVEYAAAFKNVVSILAGVINGMGYSYGSETHIITRAAHEIEIIATDVYGARPETFSMHSQCWGNDLWMSCTGATRNREFGILIGEGRSATEAMEAMATARKTIEGVQTLHALKSLSSLTRYPLIEFLTRLVGGEAPLSDVEVIIQGRRF